MNYSSVHFDVHIDSSTIKLYEVWILINTNVAKRTGIISWKSGTYFFCMSHFTEVLLPCTWKNIFTDEIQKIFIGKIENLCTSRGMDMKNSVVKVRVSIRPSSCPKKFLTFLTAKKCNMLNHMCNSLLIIFLINWSNMNFHMCFKPKFDLNNYIRLIHMKVFWECT